MMQYYLAHQLIYRKIVRGMQKDIEYYYGLTLINPFYDTQRTDIQAIDQGKQSRYDIEIERCKDIVLNDLNVIRNCDGVICILFDHEVLGSFMEMFYAWNDCEIPVYLICYDEKIRNHPWIKAICYKIFSSIDEFKKYLDVNKKEMQ
jgi:hypothetical protein